MEKQINDRIKFDSYCIGKVEGTIKEKVYLESNTDSSYRLANNLKEIKKQLFYIIKPDIKFWNYGEEDVCYRSHGELFGDIIYEDGKI